MTEVGAAERYRAGPASNPSSGEDIGHAPRRDRERSLTRARTSSVRIARTCAQYAAAMRYQQVTLRDLSEASGVSERRVRAAFSESHGVPPSAYLRVAALMEVRRTLLAGPHVRDAVTRAASDFGFWHLSRFASYYKALFGEMPSETAVRARILRTHPYRGAGGVN